MHKNCICVSFVLAVGFCQAFPCEKRFNFTPLLPRHHFQNAPPHRDATRIIQSGKGVGAAVINSPLKISIFWFDRLDAEGAGWRFCRARRMPISVLGELRASTRRIWPSNLQNTRPKRLQGPLAASAACRFRTSDASSPPDFSPPSESDLRWKN